mgnify:FL=1
MKKAAIFFVSMLLLAALSVTCFAQDHSSDMVTVDSYSWQLTDEIIVVRTIQTSPAMMRSTKSASMTDDYYYSGKKVATMVLSGSFYYDGSTARATGAKKSYSTASGWSYSGGDAYISGNSVKVNGSFVGSKTYPVNMTLSCSSSGVITEG